METTNTARDVHGELLGLDAAERGLVRTAFLAMIEGEPITLDDLARRADSRPAKLRNVVTRGLVTVDEGDVVVGAAGLSLVPVPRRPHRMLGDGRAWWTWCAVDAVGIPAALGADAVAETACEWCGTPVRLELRAGTIANATHPEARLRAAALAETPYRPGAPERVAAELGPARRNGHSGGDDWYDLAIVGSGGAAFAAAIAATERGAKVVMIERGILGGTCVNIGCVPSKTQLRAGELFWRAGRQPFGGIRTRAESVDLARLVDEKDQLVSTLRREKYENLVGEYGWELVRGEARFEDAETLIVDDRAIRADGFVLATGARPSVPPIPGLDRVDYLTAQRSWT